MEVPHNSLPWIHHSHSTYTFSPLHHHCITIVSHCRPLEGGHRRTIDDLNEFTRRNGHGEKKKELSPCHAPDCYRTIVATTDGKGVDSELLTNLANYTANTTTKIDTEVELEESEKIEGIEHKFGTISIAIVYVFCAEVS
jgi:hypothetical protein